MRWVLVLLLLGGCDVVFGIKQLAPDAAPIDAPVRYVEAVLTDKPLAYWRLGVASESVAVDETGNGNTGTFVGDVKAGEPGALVDDADPAMRFDGVDDLVDVGDRLEFSDSAQFTLEVWVKPASHVVNYAGVLSKTDEDTGGNMKTGYMIFDHFDSFGAERNDGSNTNQKVETGPLTTGVWKYVAVTFDGTTLALYVDGQLQASSTTPITIPPTANGFVLGGRNGGKFLRYAGVIDEVAVYDHALSAERIDAHRRAALAP